MLFLIFLMIIIFLLAHFLLRAIPQVVMFCFSSLQKIEANNHWLTGFQRSAPTFQLGLWPLLGFFWSRTIKIVFSYFSHDYYFSTCTFSFTSNSTDGNVLFCSCKKIEADNHWLAVYQLFSWVYDYYSFFFVKGQ